MKVGRKLILISCLFWVLSSFGSSGFTRQYSLNEIQEYSLITLSQVYFNGQLVSHTWGQADAHLLTTPNKGILGDVLEWSSYRTVNLLKLTPMEDKSHEAKSVKPHWFSLLPEGTLELPDLTALSQGMIGKVTDILTFFNGLNHKFGISELKLEGDSFLYEKNRSKWDDDKHFYDTQGCQNVENTLQKVDEKDIGTIVTSFFPPDTECLEFSAPWMKEKVADTPNNFQMVQFREEPRPQFPEHSWQMFWGIERITDTMSVNRRGHILQADQVNLLNLKTTYCMNRNWPKPDCLKDEEGNLMAFDLTIKRRLRLVEIK